MVPSSDQGNPSGILSSSSSPRSFSSDAERSPNRSTPTMNPRDSLLGREPVVGSRNGIGTAYFQVDDLGVYLSTTAISILMGIIATVGIILLTLVITLSVLSKCPKPSQSSSSCASFALNSETNNLQGYQVPQECAGFVAHYVDSGQYRSDVAVAVEAARLYLGAIEAGHDGRDLVVFDVDETAISNMPYYVAHNYGVGEWDEASWKTWVSCAAAPAMDPILSLYTNLRAQNWSVGFISGRPQSQGQSTARNLDNAGYMGWATLILRQPIEETWHAVQYKAKYRKILENNGYRIRSSIGDQWSDLQGGSIGERTFKLPNPMYYIH